MRDDARRQYERDYYNRDEVKARRNAQQRARYRRNRALETPQEREARLAYLRMWRREHIANETPEKREHRLRLARESNRRRYKRKIDARRDQ